MPGAQTSGRRPAPSRRAGARRVPAGRPIFRPKIARLFRRLYNGGIGNYFTTCFSTEYICEQAGCSRPQLFRRRSGAGTARIFRARAVGLLVPKIGIEIGRLFQIMFRRGAFGLLLRRIVTRLGELFGYVFRRGTYELLLAKTGTEIGRLFWIMLRRGTFGVFLCGKGELFFHTCFGT